MFCLTTLIISYNIDYIICENLLSFSTSKIVYTIIGMKSNERFCKIKLHKILYLFCSTFNIFILDSLIKNIHIKHKKFCNFIRYLTLSLDPV